MKRWSAVFAALVIVASLVVPQPAGPMPVAEVQAAGGEGRFGLSAGSIQFGKTQSERKHWDFLFQVLPGNGCRRHRHQKRMDG